MITPSEVILQLGGLGGIEWVIIIGIVILLIFGVRKIPELAKSFGKAQGEYEKAKIEMRKEVERIKHGDDTERKTRVYSREVEDRLYKQDRRGIAQSDRSRYREGQVNIIIIVCSATFG